MQLQKDTTQFVTGGRRQGAGRVAYPFPGTTDFSSFLVQAQASRAKVIGLANAGADTVNAIKQAHEFGLTRRIKLAALLMFITDVHALGLDGGAGAEPDRELLLGPQRPDPRLHQSREGRRLPNNWPNMIHAGCYSGDAALPEDRRRHGRRRRRRRTARATVDRMKAMPVDDDCFGKTTIREDGRNLVAGLSVRGEEAVREQGAVGLLQAGRHHAGRRGLPAARRRPLPLRACV